MPHLKYALLCLSALIVAACGGGGGGGGSSSSTSSTPASTATVVTESNRNAVASSTIAATGVAVATTDAGYGLMFRSANKVKPVAMPGVFQLALAQVQQLNSQPEQEKRSLSTTSCRGGGSITINSQVSSTLYYTIGDTWAITYSACDMGNGYSMTGKISGTVSASSSSTGTLGVSMNFTNYAFTLNGDSLPSLTYNGDVAMTAHFAGQSVTSASLASSSFSLISKNYSLSIRNMASEATGLDTSSATYTVSCSFSEGVSGQNIAGTITTITPLVANVSGTFSSGKLKFTGNNSAVFLTFKAGNVVTLELDTNGDNVVDHAWETSITEINQ